MNLVNRVLSPANQVRLAWLNLVASAIGLPVSLLVTSEPPVILTLSWWAVIVTALGGISAAQANKEVSVNSEVAQVEAENVTVNGGHTHDR